MTEQCLTVRSGGAVQSDLHRNIEPVLHHEGGADSDHLPGAALHCDGEDNSDWRQSRELRGQTEVSVTFKSIMSNSFRYLPNS